MCVNFLKTEFLKAELLVILWSNLYHQATVEKNQLCSHKPLLAGGDKPISSHPRQERVGPCSSALLTGQAKCPFPHLISFIITLRLL